MKKVFLTLLLITVSYSAKNMLRSKFSQNPKEPNSHGVLKVSVSNGPTFDINFELFNSVVPDTVKNFIELCDCSYQNSSFCYNGVPFHRIIPGFMIQGGDFENNNGTGAIKGSLSK